MTHADSAPKFTNRLANESSPYLLQHAHNPVDWYPWGEEAFKKARDENLPILLSIGYSTCHWCHVMERESFENEEIAEFMNQHYVCIKVDREQRPDVDAVYMASVQLMTGQGGWPMTVWLTPKGEPFYGGTYFPPEDGHRGMRIGFFSLLERLHEVYHQNPDEVVRQSAELSRAISNQTAPPAKGDLPTASLLKEAFETFESQYDAVHGGFGSAPKFPRPSAFTFLFGHAANVSSEKSKEMVLHTLRKMARGGIYDQVGGGFHRYSTDHMWLVPHFEKMLYDNAQLVVSYLEAFQITGEELFSRIARETLDYVAREMTDAGGGFYSATDADSEGHEGTFFVWTAEEIDQILGEEEAKLISEYFGVTVGGNFEGKNILSVVVPPDEFARKLKIPQQDLMRRINDACGKLYEARKTKIPPHTDDKILTAWNGLMLGAFARAGFVLNDEKYTKQAECCAQFILDKLQIDGRLYRSYRKEKVESLAFLDDYAFLAWGFLELFEATQDIRWLCESRRLQDELLKRFWDDENGGFFMSSREHEKLLAKEKPYYDGAEPSGNAIAASNFLRLYALTDHEPYRAAAEKTVLAFSKVLEKAPAIAPNMLAAFDGLLHPFRQVAIVRSSTDTTSDSLINTLRQAYMPRRVIAVVTEGKDLEEKASELPWLIGRTTQTGKSTAYVCHQGRCDLPTSDSDQLKNQLRKTVSLPEKGK